ncbi:RloB family protein [Elizabethkingia anophelis]|uniref:RloB family protein n=1 Tax=Elizabethkingia anophelis TaxID=1117645 RepID=UPI00293CF34B|nr:hypothetical protein [Elizabethkingia anophelis]
MSNPWDIRTDTIRSANTIFTFHLFCEDRNCEPLYFESFGNDKVKIVTHTEQGSMFKNLIKTIMKCKNNGFLKKRGNKYVVANKGIDVWCVFDRDKGGNGEQDIDEGDVSFDLAITTAIHNGVNVAWSNDAFELWVMLHLMDIDDYEGAKDRTHYYEKLKLYFQNHSNPNDDLRKALQHSFGYKHSLKSRSNFKNIVLAEILPYVNDAVQRAEQLVERYTTESDHSKKGPCTMAHLLVKRILEKGGVVSKN